MTTFRGQKRPPRRTKNELKTGAAALILYNVQLQGLVELSDNTCGPVPIPVATLSKAWVDCRSLTGIVGSNPA
jgi:hypothetical protein